MAFADLRIMQQEVQHLRRFPRWQIYITLLAALLVALPFLFPFSFPSSYNSFTILIDWKVIAAMIGAHLFFIVVCVRTAALASYSLNREFKSQNWDLLTLSGIGTWRILWSKWWAVMRYVWLEHVISALPRLAFWAMLVTTGYKFFLLDIDNGLCFRFPSLLGPYCTRSFSMYGDLSPLQVAASIVILCLFAFAEAGLITAIGLATAAFFRNKTRIEVLLTLVFRVMLMASTIVIILFGANVIRSGLWGGQSHAGAIATTGSFCDQGMHGIPADQCETVGQQRMALRVLETLQTGVFNLVDNGSLLQVNLLRPGSTLGSLARNGISAIIGLTLYGLLTIAFMLSARRFTRRAEAM